MSFAEDKLWTGDIVNMILFCLQDDLQGTVSSVLYTEKWLTRDRAAGKDGFQVRVSLASKLEI